MAVNIFSSSIDLIDLDQFEILEDDSTESKKRKRTSDEQLSKIIAFMEEYPDFGKGSTKSDNDKTLAWECLVAELNALGPPQHTSREWRTVWSRYKGNKKRKSVEIKSNPISPSSLVREENDEHSNKTPDDSQSGSNVIDERNEKSAYDTRVIDLLSQLVENTSNILDALKNDVQCKNCMSK
ncbi:hypothetical protein Bhyg_07572 [Pseudolycoriella hygida]|uniref:Regulatory protein zeste n=1 Tax=Pseudolycoriella hygida TaxID=35572 RepID=A0A9Q0N2X8_9DIPT|nr:hypothetical protein Bhyg_07572 [Pseudolycoriella hygida]